MLFRPLTPSFLDVVGGEEIISESVQFLHPTFQWSIHVRLALYDGISNQLCSPGRSHRMSAKVIEKCLWHFGKVFTTSQPTTCILNPH